MQRFGRPVRRFRDMIVYGCTAEDGDCWIDAKRAELDIFAVRNGWATPESVAAGEVLEYAPFESRSEIFVATPEGDPQRGVGVARMIWGSAALPLDEQFLVTSMHRLDSEWEWMLNLIGLDRVAEVIGAIHERGWSYGARGAPNLVEHQVPYIITAPVQADRTGDSIRAIQEQVRDFLTTRGVQVDELNRLILGNTRQLPGQFETSPSVLGALRTNALYRRPDNYWETVADRYRQMTASGLDAEMRRVLDPADFVWVVVGEAARVRPQLEPLGLPIEVIQPR